jgi:hypothetical protein
MNALTLNLACFAEQPPLRKSGSTQVRATHETARKLHLLAQAHGISTSDLLDEVAKQLPDVQLVVAGK